MNKWIVAKFGGSSVKDAEAMLRCSNVVDSNPDIKIVVISATQNTTNQLEFIARAAQRGDEDTLNSLVSELSTRHLQIANELFSSNEVITNLHKLFDEAKTLAAEILKERSYTPKIMDQLYLLIPMHQSLKMRARLMP